MADSDLLSRKTHPLCAAAEMTSVAFRQSLLALVLFLEVRSCAMMEMYFMTPLTSIFCHQISKYWCKWGLEHFWLNLEAIRPHCTCSGNLSVQKQRWLLTCWKIENDMHIFYITYRSQLCDVCWCSLEIWFQETLNCWTMLVAMKLTNSAFGKHTPERDFNCHATDHF